MSVSGVGSSVGAGSSTIPITGSDSVPISVTSGLLTVGSNQISVSNSTNNSPADSQLQTLDLASDIGLASSAAGATGDQVLDGIDAALLGVSSANSLSLNGVSVGVSGGSATQSSTFGANGYTSYDSSSQTATYQPFNSSSAALTLSGLATAPTLRRQRQYSGHIPGWIRNCNRHSQFDQRSGRKRERNLCEYKWPEYLDHYANK